jgi:hypothetical protein
LTDVIHVRKKLIGAKYPNPKALQNEVDEPLETAHHLLCKCPAFNIERTDLYASHTITEQKVFSKSTITNLSKIITFFNKIKVLNRTPKHTKTDLSPHKRKQTNKNKSNKKRKTS